MAYLFIFFGGGLGALLRFLTINMTEILSHKIHFLNNYHSIIIVNFIGCIIYALALILITRLLDLSDNLKLFIFTGLIASYTTFSTFVFETFEIYFNEGLIPSIEYFFASLIFSFIGFFLIYRLHVQTNL